MIKYILFIFIFSITVLFSSELSREQEKLYNEIINEFKDDFEIWDVTFDKKSFLIRFAKNEILFKIGKVERSNLFNIVLKDFYPRYINIVAKNKEIVKKLLIKGHTSSENAKFKTKKEKYNRNLILSLERSDSVLRYVMELTDDSIVSNKDWIESIIESKGLSSSELILDKYGKEDKKLSRRIEFGIIFNETNLNYEEAKVVDIESDILEEERKVITLSDYVKRLLDENPYIDEQFQLLSSIRQDIKIANSAFYPTAALNYNYKKYYNYDDGTLSEKDFDTSKDITVRYNIFNGFNDSDEKRIAQLNYRTNIFTKDQVENELIYNIVEAFITIQKTNEYYELSRKNYSDYIKWMDKEEIRFQNGLVSLADYSKIHARGISRFMNFEEDTKRYVDSITTMQKYIDFNDSDMEYFEVLNPYSIYFESSLLAIKDCQDLSPYIKEANQNIKLYKAKLEKSKVHFYPKVDLIGKQSVLYEENTVVPSTTTDETSLTLEASMQFYSGGKDQANYKKKLFEYRQKIQKRDAVVRDVIYKVDLSLNSYELTTVKNEYLIDLVNKREEEYLASNYDYKFAKIDANGLLDVVDAVYNAKRQYIENRYEMILSKYKVLNQIGIIKNNIFE
ncbi:MAG: TolC family protein [Arcobacteraceae bacterium]|nr:TolC family protein [Arcobacteraceae bacterium]